MKTEMRFVPLAAALVALAAYLVHEPGRVQADEVPEKYRATVHKGLEYLVKNQHKDGHWEGDGGKHPVAMTGLVGLALLMEGTETNVREWKYSANIQKAADWLMDNCRPVRGGLIYSEHDSETPRYMEGHGLATLFLAGILQNEPDGARRKKIDETVTAAVKYIVKAQSSQGGWYHTSKMEGHDLDAVLTTVIQIQALQAAANAGISFQEYVLNDAFEYLKTEVAKYDKKTSSAQNRSRQVETAAALACRLNRRRIEANDIAGIQWLKFCQREIPLGRAMQCNRDALSHYFYAQTVINMKSTGWIDYRSATFDELQAKQNKDGSWPACNGIGVGPIYATALWCTVLQLDKGGHPSARRTFPRSD